MSDRSESIIVFWGCKCPQEIGEIPAVETKCTSVQRQGKVVMTGFVERCNRCKNRLGEGYGDMNHFDTIEEAKEFANHFKIGEWIEDRASEHNAPGG